MRPADRESPGFTPLYGDAPMSSSSSFMVLLISALLAACNQGLGPEGSRSAAGSAQPVAVGGSPALDRLAVDPASLTPDPVASSDEGTQWDCRSIDGGVMCTGHRTAVEDGTDIGACADQTLFIVRGTANRDQVRNYNADLLETSREVHLTADETLGLSLTGSGATLSAKQNILQKITFGVPGALETRVRTETGLYLQVREAHGRVIFQSAGSRSYDEANELIDHNGRFEDAFLETICPVLLGS